MTVAFKADLPTAQKFVLVALCDSANDQGECYPSVTTLMAKCSMSDRGVQKALVELEARACMRREFRNGRSTVYWMTPERCSPRTAFPPNVVHPSPERGSPPPPNNVHHTPEQRSPRTITESSVEPLKNRKEKRATGTRLPSDWVPSEADLRYAADKGVDAAAEAESFRDHWLADTTVKAVKADWAAAWRTWCRNSLRFAKPAPKAQQSFRQKDEAAARAKASQWTGGLLGNDPNTLDMEPTDGHLALR